MNARTKPWGSDFQVGRLHLRNTDPLCVHGCVPLCGILEHWAIGTHPAEAKMRLNCNFWDINLLKPVVLRRRDAAEVLVLMTERLRR